MHWIRIDGYFRGSYENPELHFEPMACQHCEKAPCAPVCPFNAVMESVDGINEQIYNRCVGTKYCENNCPYKVRRFNFLQYSDQITPVIQLMNNPDVTVRSRGVMEKCTYCIQRVNYAKFQAEKENRRVRDGEIVTACAQSCPTNAIVFGNINDPNSAVSKLKRSDLTYGLLLEANTMPRTSYLAKFKNPNPALKDYMPAFLIGEHASEKPEGQTYVGEEDATRVGSGKPKE
jgi:molybdopterin-containing oxidoreductase family iron-sulfur binding subunit